MESIIWNSFILRMKIWVYRTNCYTWKKEECHLNICEIRGKEYWAVDPIKAKDFRKKMFNISREESNNWMANVWKTMTQVSYKFYEKNDLTIYTYILNNHSEKETWKMKNIQSNGTFEQLYPWRSQIWKKKQQNKNLKSASNNKENTNK